MSPENDTQSKQAGKSGRFPIKSILIILAIMLLEGGLFAAWVVFKPSPRTAEAGMNVSAEVPKEQTAEAVIVESGRFPNRKTGRLYMYDMEIAVQVDKNVAERVEKLRKENEALILDRIRAIVARAEPSYFDEDDLQTLKRQLKVMLDEVFGEDTVKEVFIKTCNPYRIE